MLSNDNSMTIDDNRMTIDDNHMTIDDYIVYAYVSGLWERLGSLYGPLCPDCEQIR